MKPADLGLLRVPGAPTLAPDGRTVVVAVDRMDLSEDAYRGQLWQVPTEGGAEPRQLTHGWRDSVPRYSPDGRWLAFLRAVKDGKPQLMVMPTDGGEPRRLTDHHLGVGAPVWSPDSTRLAYTSRVPEEGRYGTVEGLGADKEAPRRISTLQYRLDSLGFTVDRWQHVFVVDALTPDAEPQRVTEGDYDHEQPVWTPDGRRLVFSARRHAGRDRDLINDLYTCELDGGDLRRITDTSLSVGNPAVSPDGGTVYFVGGELGEDGRTFAGRNDGLYAVPFDGASAPKRLTDTETVHLAKPSAPLLVAAAGGWSPATRSPTACWSPPWSPPTRPVRSSRATPAGSGCSPRSAPTSASRSTSGRCRS
jgi:Tol biopolymer transport system component